MPQALRPLSVSTKIAYKVLNTPKDMRQKNRPPTERQALAWLKDSIKSSR